MTFKEFASRFDWSIFFTALVLAVLGLLTIYSSSFYRQDFFNFEKQLVFIVFGAIAMLIFSLIDWRIWRDNRFLTIGFYLACLLALLGLLFFPSVSRGGRSWYALGQFYFDPIEITKIVLVIMLAKYFSNRHIELYRIYHIIISGTYVILPVILILLQPELGSAIILILLWISVLLVSGVKIRHFLLLSLLGIVLFVLAWIYFLQDYQKNRIITYLTPSLAPLEAGWNQDQAKIAIGSGGIFGQGFLKGTQIGYGFLPASQTDFAFAGVVEEFGLVGAFLVLGGYLLIIRRLLKIALHSQSNFPRLFSLGLAIIFLTQGLINIGMNLGLMPIIGIPLPLISYGGSALFVAFISLGIAESMKIYA
jgi:rod shape determining protein RodA